MELGLPAEAEAELAKISAGNQRYPDVLEIRWLLLAQAERWDEALKAAQALVEVAPKRSSGWLHQAYALRRATGGGIEKAWGALLPAHEKFPREATIAYNLSCYACQMDHLEEARDWFHRALKIGGKDKIKKMALADSDLRPLWDEIRSI
jgi:tetratricopeptide (TPR) repeat protein